MPASPRRRRPPKPPSELERNLDPAIEALCFGTHGLSKALCPSCKQPTLIVEMVMRSGVRITCDGYDPTAEDHACAYNRVALISSYLLRAADTPTPESAP